MIVNKLLFALSLLFLTQFSFSQNIAKPKSPQSRPGMNKAMAIGRFSGKVKEAVTNEAMVYASVQLWQIKMDTIS